MERNGSWLCCEEESEGMLMFLEGVKANQKAQIVFFVFSDVASCLLGNFTRCIPVYPNPIAMQMFVGSKWQCNWKSKCRSCWQQKNPKDKSTIINAQIMGTGRLIEFFQISSSSSVFFNMNRPASRERRSFFGGGSLPLFFPQRSLCWQVMNA